MNVEVENRHFKCLIEQVLPLSCIYYFSLVVKAVFKIFHLYNIDQYYGGRKAVRDIPTYGQRGSQRDLDLNTWGLHW